MRTPPWSTSRIASLVEGASPTCFSSAPIASGALLKQAGLAPSTSEALRLVDQGGVRIDGAVVSDRGLKLAAGTYVVRVGTRKFARVTLAAG